MSSFIVEGGHRLSGSIAPQGAKNEALEVISAILLTSEDVTISNIPDILDIRNLIALLQGMGVKVTRHSKGEYTFNASRINEFYVSSAEFVEQCARLRGSVMVVGPLLARFGLAYFPKPGGDKIGRRRLDMKNEIVSLDEMEKEHIRRTIDHCHGNLTQAAELLGITRQTLYNKMKRL